MTDRTRYIYLGLVLLVIAGSIFYLEKLKPQQPATSESTNVDLANSGDLAPELQGISGYINTEPFKLHDLFGQKVILVDFWTYSCINCQRTLPYLNAWYDKYKDQGLVIVGVHTPEFQFEHELTNVQAAVKKFGITYPVVLDNSYGTWQAFQNLYWPREYLIDIHGKIVHDHIGEGDYDETEKAIQAALADRMSTLHEQGSVAPTLVQPSNVISMDDTKVQSPETYFGAARNEFLGNAQPGVSGLQTLSTPVDFEPNTLYLQGQWNFLQEWAQSASSDATITYRYRAKNVYLVAGADNETKITVSQDGQTVTTQAGEDVAKDGTVTVHEHRLYHLIQNVGYSEHVLQIKITQPGLQAYTFTFG